MEQTKPDDCDECVYEPTTLDRLAPVVALVSQVTCVAAACVGVWAVHVAARGHVVPLRYLGRMHTWFALPYLAMFLVIRRARWHGLAALLCLLGSLAVAGVGVGFLIVRGILSSSPMTVAMFVWLPVFQFLCVASLGGPAWWMQASLFRKMEDRREVIFFKEKFRARKNKRR